MTDTAEVTDWAGLQMLDRQSRRAAIRGRRSSMTNRVRLAIVFAATLAVCWRAVAQGVTHSGELANGERSQQTAQATPEGAAPSGATAGQAGGAGASLTSGTTIYAALDTSLDSKKAKPGDVVAAHVTEAVKVDGKVAIPKGAKLIGQVTRATARGKGDPDSMLAIKFDKATVKNGPEMAMNVWIRAMAEQQRSAHQATEDMGVLAGTGSAAEAGSPMKPTHSAVAGVNDAAGSVPLNATGGESGLNSAGQLTAKSRGVFGMDGVELTTDFSNFEQGSVISSTGKNVHLEGGTRLLLVLQGEVAVEPKK
jgi:hypothetical protein